MGPERGRLIALEGIDGCGKSTQARALAAALGARLTHEPGATPLGARLRELLLTPEASGAPGTTGITPRAEALLMAADQCGLEDQRHMLGPVGSHQERLRPRGDARCPGRPGGLGRQQKFA